MDGKRRGGRPRAGGRRTLRQRVFERALVRELRRIRQLLEMDDTAYSDLAVLSRAREELQAIGDDDAEELEEEELEDE